MLILHIFCLLQLIEVAPDTYDDLVKAKKTCSSVPPSAIDILKKKVSELMSASSTHSSISSFDPYWLPQVL